MQVNNNKNYNFYFLYYHPNGDKILLFQQKEYNLAYFANHQIAKNSTLVVVDNLLFQEGKLVFFIKNFTRVIFLPYLLKRYLGLIEKLGKTNILFIIYKNNGNVAIRANHNQYLLHYDVEKEQLESLDELELPIEILSSSGRIMYTMPLYIMELLRVGYRHIIKFNIILILLNMMIYLYGERVWCH